jgi:hypothetical protein
MRALDWNRTSDTRRRGTVLYPLSYKGMKFSRYPGRCFGRGWLPSPRRGMRERCPSRAQRRRSLPRSSSDSAASAALSKAAMNRSARSSGVGHNPTALRARSVGPTTGPNGPVDRLPWIFLKNGWSAPFNARSAPRSRRRGTRVRAEGFEPPQTAQPGYSRPRLSNVGAPTWGDCPGTIRDHQSHNLVCTAGTPQSP